MVTRKSAHNLPTIVHVAKLISWDGQGPSGVVAGGIGAQAYAGATAPGQGGKAGRASVPIARCIDIPEHQGQCATHVTPARGSFPNREARGPWKWLRAWRGQWARERRGA